MAAQHMLVAVTLHGDGSSQPALKNAHHNDQLLCALAASPKEPTSRHLSWLNAPDAAQ